ncbi:MAG: hypothetical protein IKS28_07070 [Clostridia bacterium]|nr:hypothetical protein [Clostridia bacterium]
MKKTISILLTAVITLALSASMVIGSSAVDPIVCSASHYFVVNFDNPDAVVGPLFNWGYCGGFAAAEGSVKIPKGTGQGTELTIGHASNIAGANHANWITSTLKYAAVTYKTAADGAIGFKFAPTEAKWGADPGGWKAEDYQVISLPSSGEFTTVITPLASAVQYSDPLFLFALTCDTAAEDIFVKNIGFFVSEDEAKSYYGLQGGSTPEPEPTGSFVVTAENRYTVVNLKPADQAISSVFNVTQPAYTATDNGIKFSAGVPFGEMNGYGTGFEENAGKFVPSAMKFAVIRYKTSADTQIRVRFAVMNGEDWGSSWGDLENYSVVADLTATEDYNIAVVEITDAMKTGSAPFLVGYAPNGDIPADIEITNVGFFASEELAREYFGIKSAGTSDFFAIPAALSAIVLAGAAAVLGKKRK